MHLVLTITEGSNGGYAGQLNSIDQGAILPMDSVTVQATKVHFEVKAVGGDYQGVLNVTHSGADAAREFEKILDHLGVDPVSPYISLAHLGLARADNLMGEKTKSLKEYEYFFQLWKDADNNIPILQVARREYSALSHSAGGTAGLPAINAAARLHLAGRRRELDIHFSSQRADLVPNFPIGFPAKRNL